MDNRRQKHLPGLLNNYPVPEVMAAILLLIWYLVLHSERTYLSMIMIISVVTFGSFAIYYLIRPLSLSNGLFIIFVIGCETYMIIWADVSPPTPSILLTLLSNVDILWIIEKMPGGQFHVGISQEDTFNNPQVIVSETRRTTVGIFSRSGPAEYKWLVSYINKSVGSHVVPFVITNSNSFQFRDEVSRCTFAILYHSKTRGRINITDVTDSLYDVEMKYLSSELGKQNVVVVVDDLDDSDSLAKNKILQTQPTIAKLARDVILISTDQKLDYNAIRSIMKPVKLMISKGKESCGYSSGNILLMICVISTWIGIIFGVPNPTEFYSSVLIIITNLKGSFILYGMAFSGNKPDSLLPMFVVTSSQKKSTYGKELVRQRFLLYPLLLTVLIVLLSEISIIVWRFLFVHMVPYMAIALLMDVLITIMFTKGPQVFRAQGSLKMT